MKNIRHSAIIALFLTAAAGLFLSACNTIHGAGKDIERGGEDIQHAAK